MQKTCFKCRLSKDISMFYKHAGMSDGRLNKCIECTKNDVRINRRANIDYYRRYDKDRAKKNPDRNKKQSIRTRDKRRNSPEYLSAHNAVARAIKKGVIVKQPCQMCGSTEYVHAHHDDYSRPLAVMWLCAEHHSARHDFLDYIS